MTTKRDLSPEEQHDRFTIGYTYGNKILEYHSCAGLQRPSSRNTKLSLSPRRAFHPAAMLRPNITNFHFDSIVGYDTIHLISSHPALPSTTEPPFRRSGCRLAKPPFDVPGIAAARTVCRGNRISLPLAAAGSGAGPEVQRLSRQAALLQVH